MGRSETRARLKASWQTLNLVALCPSGAWDGTSELQRAWVTPPSLSQLGCLWNTELLSGRLCSMLTALLGGYLLVLSSPASWSPYHSLGFIITVSCKCLPGTLEGNPMLLHIVWPHRCKPSQHTHSFIFHACKSSAL